MERLMELKKNQKRLMELKKNQKREIDGLPFRKNKCPRCGQISMYKIGPVEFRVRFWLFNRGVSVSMGYCPKCGLVKAFIRVF